MNDSETRQRSGSQKERPERRSFFVKRIIFYGFFSAESVKNDLRDKRTASEDKRFPLRLQIDVETVPLDRAAAIFSNASISAVPTPSPA